MCDLYLLIPLQLSYSNNQHIYETNFRLDDFNLTLVDRSRFQSPTTPSRKDLVRFKTYDQVLVIVTVRSV